MIGVGTTAMGSRSQKEIGLSSECNKDKWEFVAKDQGRELEGITRLEGVGRNSG